MRGENAVALLERVLTSLLLVAAVISVLIVILVGLVMLPVAALLTAGEWIWCWAAGDGKPLPPLKLDVKRNGHVHPREYVRLLCR